MVLLLFPGENEFLASYQVLFFEKLILRTYRKNHTFIILSKINYNKICSPSLSWRDIQHLTVLTSKRNSLYDAKNRFHWTMNGVGLEFNHLFGFGVLDAGGMVTLSKQWQTVPPRYHCEAGAIIKLQ